MAFGSDSQIVVEIVDDAGVHCMYHEAKQVAFTSRYIEVDVLCPFYAITQHSIVYC